MSIATPRARSSGNTVAALPTRPTLSGVRASFAASTRATASSRSSVISSRYPCSTRRCRRVASTSTMSTTPSFMVTASGCAPPMPPQPPVSVRVPARLPPNRARAIAPKVSYVPCRMPCVPM